MLTRALGVRSQVEPDLAEITPQVGDVFAMCSDGLTTHLVDSEIAAAVGQEGDLQAICDDLVDQANQRGGTDNTTVVLVRVGR